LVSSNIQEAMDVLSLRGPTVAGAAQPTSLRRGAALAVQPPVPHARGSGISGTKAALGVLGCALFARREQALSRRRGHIGRAASAEVEEAPKRLRRRRRVPKSKPQTEITSDMLTLNTCNCDLILDTVVEFEDLLAPNEARALLDAARVTAETNGWGAATHEKYGTKDVKIRDLKSTAAQKIFQDKLAAPLIEAIGEYFELPPKSVVVDDAFIVRYATDSQRGLSFHRDGSIVSSIVTLSDENDYVGGGTEFLDGSVYRPSQGGGILFGGQRLHGGVEIERGARYICTIFFKCGGLSCRDLAVKKDKEEEGDPGIWGALANIMGVGQ